MILTGGDPLMLAARRLGELIAALDAIPHVAVIRVHSRVPVVDPGRVTAELVTALKPRRASLWLGIHCNHARELAAPARAALARLAADLCLGRATSLPEATIAALAPGRFMKPPG